MTKPSLARTLGLFGATALLTFGLAGCKSSSDNAANTAAINDGTAPIVNGSDPADANLAPASNTAPTSNTRVLGTSSSYTPQQQGESYQQQQAAPIVQGYNDQDQNDEYAGEDAVDYSDQAPPPLPEYDQPEAPDPNYIWTPGYWGWSDGGYYWVPGAWCPPPYYGALWTPPYWGYYNHRYGFHRGYWGPHVGFYGGVDYGFGYIGIGYFGGYWRGHDFYYNRDVTHVGDNIHNVYNHTVVYNNVTYNGRIQNRVSYNGGQGGINVRPRPSEMAALRETHAAPLPEQRQVAQAAAQNKQQFYSANHGKPAEIARAQPVGNVHAIAAPPAAVVHEQQHAEQVRATMAAQHGNPATNEQRGAPAAQQRGAPAIEQRGAPAAQQQRGAPMNEQRGAPTVQQRGVPAMEQHAAPAQQHNMPEQRTAPQQQQHAVPQQQREMPQQQRSMPQQQRSMPPRQRATPEQRVAPQQRAMPERAAPAPQQRPAPEQRSAPAQRPAPEQRAAPQQHNAPAPRPAPQSRPAPQQHAAPPQHEERPH
jgi:hypothetical protein